MVYAIDNSSFLEVIKKGETNKVRQFIEDGVDVNGISINTATITGNNALIEAVMTGKLEIVTLLLEAGADPNNTTEIKKSPLNIASIAGFTKIAGELIRAGADINFRDQYGFTPLMRASYYGCTGIVKLLIETGADLDLRTSKGHLKEDGMSALDWAIHRRNNEIIQILEEASLNSMG
jgi:ankyrin repeat protein